MRLYPQRRANYELQVLSMGYTKGTYNKTGYARSALALNQGMSLYLPWVVDLLNILTSFWRKLKYIGGEPHPAGEEHDAEDEKCWGNDEKKISRKASTIPVSKLVAQRKFSWVPREVESPLSRGGDSPEIVRILANRGEEWRSVVKGYLKVIAMVMVMVIVRDIVPKNPTISEC